MSSRSFGGGISGNTTFTYTIRLDSSIYRGRRWMYHCSCECPLVIFHDLRAPFFSDSLPAPSRQRSSILDEPRKTYATARERQYSMILSSPPISSRHEIAAGILRKFVQSQVPFHSYCVPKSNFCEEGSVGYRDELYAAETGNEDVTRCCFLSISSCQT